MQLTPRYLVNNRTTIVANEAGFITEYRPVYQRNLIVYKGIDNTLEFRVLNADQKPIDLTQYLSSLIDDVEIRFIAFDENMNQVLDYAGEPIIGNDSAPVRGLFKVVVKENDLLNLKEQYLSYNIYLVNSNNEKILTYTDTHFGNNGIIYISGEAFPGPRSNYQVSSFTEDDGIWNSETITAQPALNGNEALHTAVFYTDGYSGDITVQATLENEIDGSSTVHWADLQTITLTGSETEPTPVNFNGVFSYLRFVAAANPANTISKILVRN